MFDDRAGLITAQHQVSRGEAFDLKLEIRDRALTSKPEALRLSLDILARCAATAQRSSNQWLSKARKSYQKKRYELAVSQYLSATYANVNNAYAFAETGLALLKLKDERAALNIFKAAHKLKLKSGKAQRKYSAALYYNEALSHLALAERAQQSAERLDHVQAAVTALTSSLRLRPSKSVEAKLKKAQVRLEGLQDTSSKLCEEVKSYRGITPKTYPSLDQFTQSTMKMSSAQALKRGEVERPHERILLTWDVWDQDRAVTWVDDQGRAHSFGALFFTSRGHGCG